MNSSSGWPDPEAVEHFKRRGWITSPDWVPADLLDEAAEAVQAYYLGERDHELPIRGGFLDWREEHGEALRLNDYTSLQSDGIRRLVCWPGFGRAAAALMGAGEVRLFHDQLVTKPPATAGVDTSVGWHVDKAYWQTCTSERMLTVWIPFQDCSVESGPLSVIDGSHLWEGTAWMSTFTVQRFSEIEARLGRALEHVPLVLRRGQVSFHDSRTIHGSFPNHTGSFRTALALHMQDGENRYQPSFLENGRPRIHVNDVLCRKRSDGAPDYTDPGICPKLWPVE